LLASGDDLLTKPEASVETRGVHQRRVVLAPEWHEDVSAQDLSAYEQTVYEKGSTRLQLRRNQKHDEPLPFRRPLYPLHCEPVHTRIDELGNVVPVRLTANPPQIEGPIAAYDVTIALIPSGHPEHD
jgi:hypothetical protein